MYLRASLLVASAIWGVTTCPAIGGSVTLTSQGDTLETTVLATLNKVTNEDKIKLYGSCVVYNGNQGSVIYYPRSFSVKLLNPGPCTVNTTEIRGTSLGIETHVSGCPAVTIEKPVFELRTICVPLPGETIYVQHSMASNGYRQMIHAESGNDYKFVAPYHIYLWGEYQRGRWSARFPESITLTKGSSAKVLDQIEGNTTASVEISTSGSLGGLLQFTDSRGVAPTIDLAKFPHVGAGDYITMTHNPTADAYVKKGEVNIQISLN